MAFIVLVVFTPLYYIIYNLFLIYYYPIKLYNFFSFKKLTKHNIFYLIVPIDLAVDCSSTSPACYAMSVVVSIIKLFVLITVKNCFHTFHIIDFIFINFIDFIYTFFFVTCCTVC